MAILNRLTYILALLGLSLTSCYSDFEPDVLSKPVLCMNAVFTAGDSVRVELTRTWRYDEGIPGEDFNIFVTDAKVLLYVNDEAPETLVVERHITSDPYFPQYKDRDVFVSKSYIPRPGDRIRLEAVSENYGAASAEVTVPRQIKIDHVEKEVKNIRPSRYGSIPYMFDIDLLVYFTDSDATQDYYKFDCKSSPYYYGDSGAIARFYYTLDLTAEPLFTEHVSTLESVIANTSGYSIFSDRQINGHTYPLHISLKDLQLDYNNPNNNPELANAGVDLILSAISPDYYKHVLSVWEAEDGIVGSLGGVGLGELVSTYSNVSSGAGIVAASTPTTYHLALPPLIPE